MSSSLLPLRFWLLVILVGLVKGADDSLYGILGVPKSSTAKQIKSAYRKKALDTHPDKNPDVPPEEAAESFRKVVEAFEILSDKTSRDRYDRTGQTTSQNGFGGGQQQRYQGRYGAHTFTWNFNRRPVHLKDKFEVKQAMSRVLHIVSLDQLKTIMLDENDLLERNLLLCFVSVGDAENWVRDEMVFPYPFAHKSSQGIWWEDILQTVQIRFHKNSELTRFFGIDGEEIRDTQTPVFLFGKRRTKLSDASFNRIATRNRKEFETWVWKRIEVEVVFINHHTSAVEIYWVHSNNAKLQVTLEPGRSTTHTTMLSHEWYVRDVRVDSWPDSPGRHKLSLKSSMGSWKILNDTSPQEIIIPHKKCYDLSGHCAFWYHYGECTKNPKFMDETCKLTCGNCNPADDERKPEEIPVHDKDEL